MQERTRCLSLRINSFMFVALALPACDTGAENGDARQSDTRVTAAQALAPVAGTWAPLPFNTVTNASSAGTAVVLTDGTLLVQSAADWHVWSKFTPDSTGNYLSGTWSAAASSTFGRLYYPFAILKDGRFFTAGGEDLSGSESDHATVEIYDPLANTWTRYADSPLGDIGDVPYQILTDGRVIMGYRFGNQVEIFDPSNGSWSAGPSINSGSAAEQTWSLLPSGAILDPTEAQPQLYVSGLNQWVNAAVPPVTMQDPNGGETGPAVFLPNGQLLAMSAFGNAVLYTPGSTASSPGSWQLGPSVPPPSQPNDNPNGSQYTEDVAAALEPNGKVMLISSDVKVSNPANFSEYDPTTNTISAIPAPPISSSQSSFLLRLMVLPSGQLLLTGTGTNDFVYTPVGSPSDAWRPTIQSVIPNSDGSFTISGTQLNGLSQGASYGDEGDARSNFPLVRLTSGSTVHYARTLAFSTMGIATGSATVQAHFTLPSGIPAGTYQLSVVANGIASAAVSFTVGTQNDPCAGFCSNPLVFGGPNYQSGNVGTGAVCRETTSVLHGGNCSNIGTRTLTVNGVVMNCTGWTLPATHNGGYCVQITAGTPDYTSFATW